MTTIAETAAKTRNLGCISICLCVMALASLVGCGRDSSRPAVEPPPQRPLRAMNSAIRRKQWKEAWKFSDAVLETHAGDADTIANVAWVAHENDKPDIAAELLIRACRAESFQNDSRVRQAAHAMIGVGQFYEAMQLLEEAIEKHPRQHQTRRWLFDFYMGTENRLAGLPHGRFLVRQRQFDLELLQVMSNTERRSHDNEALKEMTSRNPDDKRPLVGEAKEKFDLGDYPQSIQLLRSIVDAHPDHMPAQALLGRALAASGQHDQLRQWAASQTEQVKAYPGYWIAVGDWFRSTDQVSAAARAYWEATRRDPDVMESWSKLSTTLQQLQADEGGFPAETLASVEKRATLLSTFNQQKMRFDRTRSISRAIAMDIVRTLRDLGRLWEAEAWASVALTLPEDDAVPADKIRESIVSLLRKDTPWQTTDPYPEFRLDLTHLDRPAIGAIARADTGDASKAGREVDQEVSHLRLANEARDRGLDFFGRTSDHLDQPGIMLYQTLGCGGGAIDYDLDGWSDLYLAAAGGTPPKQDSASNALLRNLDGNFLDVTPESESGDRGFGQGIAVGDVNEDGFPDLLMLNYGPNTLLVNNGDGTFSDATDKLGSNGVDWSAAAAIADLDGDAISDLVIVNYCAGLGAVTKTCPLKDSKIFRSCSPMTFPGQADLFLRGTGQGGFVDRTEAWGARPSVIGRGLGVVAGSFDTQGGVDVFIANDMTNNHYWSRSLNEASFRLSESAMLRGLGGDDRSLAQGSMGIATADFDQDGDIDFYVTNFDGEYNTYHQQRDQGIWQDRTSQMRLVGSTRPLVGFGSEAIDLDNDGRHELIVANGHVDMFSRADERSLYAHPMQVFRMNDSGAYDSIGQLLRGEYLSTPHVARALWTLDANRDGLTDLAVTHQTEPVALLINRSEPKGAWIEFCLVGRDCSRDAIGSRVEVTAADQTWTAVQTSGDGYMCSNQRVLRFGLGDIGTSGCDVTVRWPDGTSQVHRRLRPNASWTVTQSDPQAFRMN